MAVDIGQAAIDAVVSHRELFVVDSQQVQDRGVDVVDVSRIVSVGRLVAPLVAGAVRGATLDAATGQPCLLYTSAAADE